MPQLSGSVCRGSRSTFVVRSCAPLLRAVLSLPRSRGFPRRGFWFGDQEEKTELVSRKETGNKDETLGVPRKKRDLLICRS